MVNSFYNQDTQAELNEQITELIPLVTLLTPDRNIIYQFQSFNTNGFTYEGVTYPFLDAIIPNTTGRRTYHSKIYELKIRNSPATSQLTTSSQIPGTTNIQNESSLEFLLNRDGGRRLAVQILYHFESPTLPDRLATFQILSSCIEQQGLITLYLGSGRSTVGLYLPNFFR